jgi:hypothetical protein
MKSDLTAAKIREYRLMRQANMITQPQLEALLGLSTIVPREKPDLEKYLRDLPDDQRERACAILSEWRSVHPVNQARAS